MHKSFIHTRVRACAQVVAVSACCYPYVVSNQDMSPYKLLLRTASGRTISIGYESPFKSSDVCGGFTPQPWEPVPPGYLLGGVVTEKVGREGFGFNRVGYVFVEGEVVRDARTAQWALQL